MADATFQLADIPPPQPDPPPPPPPNEGGAPSVTFPDELHTTATVHEDGGAAHGSGGLPQLKVETFAGQLFWLALSLIFLYVVISRLAHPKIEGVLNARAGKIKGDVEQAAEAKRKSEEAVANYDKALAEARSRGLKIGDEIRKKAEAEAEAKDAAAAQRTAAEVAKAEARIADMRAKAMANVDGVAQELAGEIVAKLTGETATAPDVSQAVAKALKTA